MEDVMENSDGYFDEMKIEGDYPENFSISLESLYKILDEDPAPPISNSSGIPEWSHLKKLDCQREPVALHPQPDFWPSEMGNPNFSNESQCEKSLSGHPFQHNGTYDCFSGPFYDETLDERNNSTSQHIESNGLFSYPAAQSSNWFRPSSTDLANSLIGSYDDSFGSFVTDDANFNKLQNNTTNCSFSPGSAEEFGLIYQQHMNFTADADLDGLNGNLVSLDGETPLQNSFSKSIDDLDNISSPCMLQMSESSLAHSTLTERHGSISERSCGMNRDAFPYSTVQNGGIHTSFVACRPEDLALPQQYKVSPEINCTEAINDSHAANNISLSVPGNFLAIAEDVLRPSMSVQVSGLPHDDVTLLCGENRKGVQLFLSKDSSKCTWQEQSTHSSVLDDSAVDINTLLPCGMCFQQCSCEDMGVKSESSTDSSPLPYNHKHMLLNGDLAYRKTISGHKMDMQMKQQKSFLKEKKQPPISNHQLQQQLSVLSRIACQSNPSRVNSTLDDDSDLFMDMQMKQQKSFLKEKKQPQISNHQLQQQLSVVSRIASQSNPSRGNSTLVDDSDLFILDDISHSVPHAVPSALVNYLPVAERCSFSNHTGSGTVRTRPDDERLTFRLALQDLSQPKSEASPPDGVLAVPLLRHQRIALSWMVQKESAGLNCSGGILADDQGLGKTISTIALILTERPPSSSCSVIKKCEFEPLNLDDEDDGGGSISFEGNRMEKLLDNDPGIHAKPEKVDCSLGPVKGRPPAGTLVVCPTSVLRQWADELQNKITRKANLTFLVYHGSNRTKDPYELAKFDVVITTYAIVSMEVPKQPLVDKDDMERGKHNGCSMLTGNLAGNKRKQPSSTSSKNPKRNIASDSSVLELAPRPLAKVGWFRVILDEAQSIKNHRTQVARACWGLRAKRRWCLSGTPIQNAVDDLYSYFRFLRYDPYAVYKSFCSTIKIPISRNPINGYKKLQAVLKTVMLRRTKGTLIDGKPIISLPPKSVTLKKVDFSDDELEFYLALEAESREQFKVYAAAGTVKQNYVNILLMLLRLRQACDHPLLVKCTVSNSVWKSSLETAKKLPMDKLIKLQTCLEACLAICTICNDPPEDAVVSICGHVFCNQCICEHLTGDDNICPSGNCRDKLCVGSVFSMDTLRRCLSQQTGPGFNSDNSICDDNPISDVEQGPKNSQERIYCSSSSKIRAALQILNSLPLSNSSPSPCDSVKPYNESSILLDNSVDTVSLGSSSFISSDQQSISKYSNVKHTEKAIVFSQWTRMLDLLEVSLKESCILYRRLDGTMSVALREKAIKDFNGLPEVTVIIMSLKAASLGLNMVAACHVVLLDLWWNPTTEDQAIDRTHRIGQTRPVSVSRLTVKDTVEDRILALQEKKRKMVASAFGEEGSGSQESRLTVEDLKYLFMV